MSDIYRKLLEHYANRMAKINAEITRRYNAAESEPTQTARETAQKKAMEWAQAEAARVRDDFIEQRTEGYQALSRRAFGTHDSSDKMFAEIDRAALIKGGKELRDEYAKADRYGNRLRQKALASRAAELGLQDVLSEHRKVDAEFVGNVKMLADYSRAMRAPGNVIRDSFTIGAPRQPYKAERKTVVRGTDGAGRPIYDIQTTWSATDPWPTAGGDDASHEAMAEVQQQAAGKTLVS